MVAQVFVFLRSGETDRELQASTRCVSTLTSSYTVKAEATNQKDEQVMVNI